MLRTLQGGAECKIANRGDLIVVDGGYEVGWQLLQLPRR